MGKTEQKRKKPRKTLIDPKIRLLLLIFLTGKLKNDPNYLAKLAKKLNYSEGSIKSHLIPELLHKNLIESLNADKESPPYRCTTKGRLVLEPFLLVRKIGIYFAIVIMVAAVSLPIYSVFPGLLYYWYLPLTTASFAFLVCLLYFYPDWLLRSAKSPLPNN